jgi:uncharacterized LabA/DUF88 family protein
MPDRGRTIVYFDNSNIFSGQRGARWRIDAEKFIALLEEKSPIWQVYFFGAATDPPRYKQTGFYRMLKEQLHWETEIFPLGQKTIRCKACGDVRQTYTEKGVDVAIATRMLTHAANRAFDTAILVSGDKDYLGTVKAIKNMALRVEVVSFRRSLSQELGAESSAPVLYLDDYRHRLERTAPDVEAEALEAGDREP